MESRIECDEVTESELARHSAITCVVGDQLYIWGGAGDFVDLNAIYILDLNNCKQWRKTHTNWSKPSQIPLGQCNQGVCAIGDEIYMYGGRVVNPWSYTNMLCKLCLKEMTWHEIIPINPRDGPGKKHICGMVEHDGKICIFGGYGYPTDHQKEKKLFSSDQGELSMGWTNELHLFDPITSK